MIKTTTMESKQMENTCWDTFLLLNISFINVLFMAVWWLGFPHKTYREFLIIIHSEGCDSFFFVETNNLLCFLIFREYLHTILYSQFKAYSSVEWIMNNLFKVNTFFTLNDFQFFTANYGKGSAYSCITNILHYLTRIQKQRLSKEFSLNKTE